MVAATQMATVETAVAQWHPAMRAPVSIGEDLSRTVTPDKKLFAENCGWKCLPGAQGLTRGGNIPEAA